MPALKMLQGDPSLATGSAQLPGHALLQIGCVIHDC